MTAKFPCRYRHSGGSEGHGSVSWTINSKEYGPSADIQNHTYNPDEKTLHLNYIGVSQNNSVYVCEFHTRENGSPCAYRSTPGNLTITPCKGKPINKGPAPTSLKWGTVPPPPTTCHT